jgi:serine/threonine-protein kinase
VKVVAADPDPVPSPREAGTGAGTGAGRGAEASKRGAAHADTTAVAPAAAEEIAQAEEALAQGNAADAIRLAQHSLYLGKSTRAFAIIVKARCRQSDLGGARAALAQIAAGQRAAVLRDCAAHGMDLR